MKKIIALLMLVCFVMSFCSVTEAATCSKCSKCAANTSCAKSVKAPAPSTCKKCSTFAGNSTDATLKIVSLDVNASCSVTPCKISITSQVEGNVSKISYSILNSQGKTVAKCNAKCNKTLKTHNCGCGGYIYTPGTYSVKLTAYGDGKCVSTTDKNAINVAPAKAIPAVKTCKTNACQKKTCSTCKK